MIKKLDESNNSPKDPESPESQQFLRELHIRSLERQARMEKMIKEWQDEDKGNATK